MKSQSSLFSTVIVPGMNHAQLADPAQQPSFLKKNDIKAEIDSQAAVASISKTISDFVLTKKVSSSSAFLKPLLDAMNLEGYYQTKPACYSSDEINPDVPTCLAGSPWVSNVAVNIMADDKNFKNKNVKLVNHDEFHRASTVYPYHHP